MSHANLPPTGSPPLHASAFRTVNQQQQAATTATNTPLPTQQLPSQPIVAPSTPHRIGHQPHAHSMTNLASTGAAGTSSAVQHAVLRKASAPTQQSQQAQISAVFKRASTSAAPTPSPPQSERNSPVPSQLTSATNKPSMEARSGGAGGGGSDANSLNSTSILSSAAHPLNYILPPVLPPPQFATVEPGLYRCGRFHEAHGQYLNSLGVRTLLYLSPPAHAPLPTALKQWSADTGVEIINIGQMVFQDASASACDLSSAFTSSASLALYTELLRSSLEHILQAQYQPMVIVCHNGIDLCSLIVGCLRRLQGCSYTSVLEELTRFHCATMLRDELTAGVGLGRGRKEAPLMNTSTALRYTISNSDRLADADTEYRMQELIEIFDTAIVTIPELNLKQFFSSSSSSASSGASSASASSPCVDWFRLLKLQEHAERRAMKKLRRSRKAQQRARELQQEKAGGEEKQQPPATPVTDSSVHSAVLQVWPCGDVAAIYASSKLVSAGVTYDKKKTLIQEDDD